MINEGILVENSLGLYVIFSVFTLLIGVMFIGGFWRGKWSLMSGSTVDKVMFRSIKDKRIFRSGDQLVFMVCLLMSLCILTNGVLEYIIPETPDVSAVFLFVAFFLSWPIRVVFILFNRNKRYEDMPKIWPFSRTSK